MRLDHLLSKEEKEGRLVAIIIKIFGDDASRGNTCNHIEHRSEELFGRRYYAGSGMGE